jgi:hypothetical protein
MFRKDGRGVRQIDGKRKHVAATAHLLRTANCRAKNRKRHAFLSGDRHGGGKIA